MNDSNSHISYFLAIKIIQSGEIKKIPLNDVNLSKIFKEFYISIIKDLKLSKKDVFLSIDSGITLTNSDLNLTVEKIIKRFGNKINLYYEKIM